MTAVESCPLQWTSSAPWDNASTASSLTSPSRWLAGGRTSKVCTYSAVFLVHLLCFFSSAFFSGGFSFYPCLMCLYFCCISYLHFGAVFICILVYFLLYFLSLCFLSCFIFIMNSCFRINKGICVWHKLHTIILLGPLCLKMYSYNEIMAFAGSSPILRNL